MELKEKGNGNKLHAKSKNHPKTTQSFAWERVGQKCTKVWPTNSHKLFLSGEKTLSRN